MADHIAIERFAEFNPSALAGIPYTTPITLRSAAFASTSSLETLIYLGTGGGKVILLSLSNSSPDTARFLKLVSVGSRLVDSIIVFNEIARVLVLSDGCLYFSDLFLSHTLRKIGSFNDVTVIAKRFHATDSPLLEDVLKEDMYSIRKKIVNRLSSGFKENGAGGAVFDSFGHYEGEIGCLLAAASDKKLFLIEFVLSESVPSADSVLDGVSVRWREIPGIFNGVIAVAWIGDSIFVGMSSGYLLISSVSGKCREIFALPDSSGIPFLRPLTRTKEVLLMVDNVGMVVDGKGQPSGGSLIFKSVPQSLVELCPYIVVTSDTHVELYRRRTGACIQKIPVVEDGSSAFLLVTNENSEGEIVSVITSNKVICFRKVSAEEQIKTLLRKKLFKLATNLVEELESDGEITRDTVSFVHAQVGFLLFFDLHFEDAVNHFLLSETMQPSEIFPFIMRDPNRWSNLVSRNRYWGLHPPPMPIEEVVDEGIMSIQRAAFLKKAGVDTSADEDFCINPPNKAELVELAIKNIIRYLKSFHDKNISSDMKEGVDTLLMYLYRALDLVDDMEKLASSPNSCVVEELESLLDDAGHLRTLALLYGSKGLCSKALEIWCVLARNYTSGFWQDTPDGGNMNSFVASGQEIAAVEASNILQESSDQELILEHLPWIAKIDPELAAVVLTSEKRVNKLSPEKVLSCIKSGMVAIRRRYLQWLIEDQDCEVPLYHTMYALLLAEAAMETIVGLDEMGPIVVEVENESSFSLRERLQLFLQASDLYDPEEVLDVIRESELWLEKALLYRKMGQENVVLQILALKLEASEAAEQYCAEIGRDDAYMQLLDLYLNPTNGKEPMFTAAVRLLHNHGESLDPLQVLEKLSPDMPLQIASDTILRMLRARLHHHRQGQMVHNLSLAINVDTSLARVEEQSRHVQLNDESTCDSCHSRLGTKLFAMYPDDTVVCYRCYRNLGESTSSHSHNLKKVANFKAGWLVSR